MLWVAREVPGFEQWLVRARNDDFEAAYFELYWLSAFARLFRAVQLNVASGEKGSDFDLLLHDGLGFESLNVEVKTRTEPLENRKKVRRFLDAARSQLPAGQPGAVVFRCSARETLNQPELDAAIQATISNSSRLAFVAYCWEPLSTDNLIAFAHACVTKTGRDDDLLKCQPRITTPEELIAVCCGG